MKQIIRVSLAVIFIASALSSSAAAQQADEDPSPNRTHPEQQPTEKAHEPVQASPSNPPSADPQTQDALAFTGIISKVQGEIVLSDPVTKMVYKFDEPSKVEQYIGKQVKVVGKLGLNSNTIHVNSIQVIPRDEHPAGEPIQPSSVPRAGVAR
jgi:hypothetical protein